MPEYCFYRKSKKLAVLERDAVRKAAQLTEDGWEKLFEEVRASDPESALKRLAAIREDEVTTERTYIAGSAFSDLFTAILK